MHNGEEHTAANGLDRVIKARRVRKEPTGRERPGVVVAGPEDSLSTERLHQCRALHVVIRHRGPRGQSDHEHVKITMLDE